MTNTRILFSQYEANITEEAEEEIEQNLKTFFTILLSWDRFEKEEGGRNE